MVPSVEVPPVTLAAPEEEVIDHSDEKNSIVIPRERLPLLNQSLQVIADHDIKQADTPVYSPGRGDGLLHIEATGICGYFAPTDKQVPTSYFLNSMKTSQISIS